jgi:hypothetical protein
MIELIYISLYSIISLFFWNLDFIFQINNYFVKKKDKFYYNQKKIIIVVFN